MARNEPRADCNLCPRLAGFRGENSIAFPDWHNRPVPSFGPLSAQLLVVGLAPGLRGANATGRPFTGDSAGILLYRTLSTAGFTRGTYGANKHDGLTMVDSRITNAVRCVPPKNRPTGEEVRTCGYFLKAELAALTNLRCIVTLGGIAHSATLRALDVPTRKAPFAHGARYVTHDGVLVLASYHCSRLNTNTGRLTPEMFESIFAEARRFLSSKERPSGKTREREPTPSA